MKEPDKIEVPGDFINDLNELVEQLLAASLGGGRPAFENGMKASALSVRALLRQYGLSND